MQIADVAPRRAGVIDHRNAEGAEPPRDRLADGAHADHADGAVAQRRLGERIVALEPLAGAQIPLGLGKFAHRAQQQSERGIGDLFGQHAGRIGQDHIVRGGPFDVHVVVADAEARDDFELGKAFHQAAGNQFPRVAAGDGANVRMSGDEGGAVLRRGGLMNRADGVETLHHDRLERADQHYLGLIGRHSLSSRHTSMVTGFSRKALTAASSSAPTAPSSTRWSQDKVTARKLAKATPPSGFSTACRRAAPTARMVACGGLMMAENSRTPYMPRLEIAAEPPW